MGSEQCKTTIQSSITGKHSVKSLLVSICSQGINNNNKNNNYDFNRQENGQKPKEVRGNPGKCGRRGGSDDGKNSKTKQSNTGTERGLSYLTG